MSIGRVWGMRWDRGVEGGVGGVGWCIVVVWRVTDMGVEGEDGHGGEGGFGAWRDVVVRFVGFIVMEGVEVGCVVVEKLVREAGVAEGVGTE